MSERIRIGIVGYGNLGRGVEAAIGQNADCTLVGIFTRRDPAGVRPGSQASPVHRLDEIEAFADRVDVLVLCGGSRDDLPVQSPALARHFNIVDSFDTHARVEAHFAAVDEAARAGGKVGLVAAGWDPGLFSLERLYGEAILPQGATYTFWGSGLSQGHSDAVRRVPGVKAGVQYTLPSEEAIERVRAGERPTLTPGSAHRRECYVVLEEGADAEAVREAIVSMPHYFAGYETRVHFIDEEALRRDHGAMPHGGFVLRSGKTGDGSEQLVEYRLQLGSNPAFTSSVLVACARAVFRMQARGDAGAKTLFDVPPALLSPRAPDVLRRELL